MSIFKKVKYVIFILVTVLQLYYFYKENFFVKVDNSKVVERINMYYENSDDFKLEILKYDGIETLNVTKINDKWISEIEINGDKKKVIKAMSFLDDYNIEKYIIEGNRENIQVKMEITSNY